MSDEKQAFSDISDLLKIKNSGGATFSSNSVFSIIQEVMKEIKVSLEKGENVYLRGFGSFVIKKRAEKTGRSISKNIAVKIPAQNIPSFKPAKIFMRGVKSKMPIS